MNESNDEELEYEEVEVEEEIEVNDDDSEYRNEIDFKKNNNNFDKGYWLIQNNIDLKYF